MKDCYWFMTAHHWLLIVKAWRLRLIRAESPCWKGELQIGPMVIGWFAPGRDTET